MASSCLLQQGPCITLCICLWWNQQKLIKKDHFWCTSPRHKSAPLSGGWISQFDLSLRCLCMGDCLRNGCIMSIHKCLGGVILRPPLVAWKLCDAYSSQVFGRCCFDPNHVVECSRYICLYTSKSTSVHMLPCQTYINVYIIYSQYMHNKEAISIDNAKYAHILSFSTHIFWTYSRYVPQYLRSIYNKGQKLSHVKNNRPYI